MPDNVPALRKCCTVHDHELGTDDAMKPMTESQKIAEACLQTTHRTTGHA